MCQLCNEFECSQWNSSVQNSPNSPQQSFQLHDLPLEETFVGRMDQIIRYGQPQIAIDLGTDKVYFCTKNSSGSISAFLSFKSRLSNATVKRHFLYVPFSTFKCQLKTEATLIE